MNSRSSYWRAQSSALLLTAVALGTVLRFFGLGSRELSIDESLSWAESSRRNVDRVLHVQHRLDSGKFPIYEIAQHGWMVLFGESEAAMRALPALIGSLSIVLVFILGVELMLAVRGDAEASAASRRALRSTAEPSPDLSRKITGEVRRQERVHGGGVVCAALCGWAAVGRNRAAGKNVFDDAGVDSRAGDFPAPRTAAWRTGELRRPRNFLARLQWRPISRRCW